MRQEASRLCAGKDIRSWLAEDKTCVAHAAAPPERLLCVHHVSMLAERRPPRGCPGGDVLPHSIASASPGRQTGGAAPAAGSFLALLKIAWLQGLCHGAEAG